MKNNFERFFLTYPFLFKCLLFPCRVDVEGLEIAMEVSKSESEAAGGLERRDL